MRMDEMNKLFEEAGFEVERKWDCLGNDYIFTIRKNRSWISKHYVYPHRKPSHVASANQREFVKRMIDDFNKRFNETSKGEKRMNIDEIKTRDDIARFCKVEGIEVNISLDYDNYPNTALIEVVNFRDVTTMWCTDWYARTEKGKIEFIKNVIKKACIKLKKNKCIPDIKDVIFNNPATIVFWTDGSKTVVKCQDDDIYDPEKGLAMAISKKALGNQGNYCNDIKKWLPEEESDDLKLESLGTVSLADAAENFRKFAERFKGKRKYNPVQKAYDMAIALRDKDEAFSLNELIGYLGEALED